MAALESSLDQALAAAHDAQALALQLSGERQALQVRQASTNYVPPALQWPPRCSHSRIVYLLGYGFIGMKYSNEIYRHD